MFFISCFGTTLIAVVYMLTSPANQVPSLSSLKEFFPFQEILEIQNRIYILQYSMLMCTLIYMYMYYLKHEKECFIIFKTRGAAKRFRYDKTDASSSVLNSLKYDYKRILIRMNNYIIILIRMNNYIKNTNEDEFYQI